MNLVFQKSMKYLLSLLFIISFSVTTHAQTSEEVPFLVCDRAVVKQAIDVSRAVVARSTYQIKPRKNIKADLRWSWQAIDALEKNVFGKRMFNLSYDVVPGASISETSIAIYPDTLKLMQNEMQDPAQGNFFMMAHEMGHMVQKYWHVGTGKEDSPHHLHSESNGGDDFNIMHAETDCIGVELMREAGQKDFSEVIRALEMVHKDCLFFREKSFCDRAHTIRAKTIENYLKTQ